MPALKDLVHLYSNVNTQCTLAARQLIDSQKGYVAIELEALAVSWAMEIFHHFLYAAKFVLETDQKPLKTILAKSLNTVLQTMTTENSDFTVKYRPK